MKEIFQQATAWLREKARQAHVEVFFRRFWWGIVLLFMAIAFPSPSTRLRYFIDEDKLGWRLEWALLLLVFVTPCAFFWPKIGRVKSALMVWGAVFAAGLVSGWIRHHVLALGLSAGWGLAAAAVFLLASLLPVFTWGKKEETEETKEN